MPTANHYTTEAARRATRCKYALQTVVDELAAARKHLQTAILQLELGRLV